MALDDRHIEDLLKENIRLSRENNKLLRRIRRTHIIDTWSRILFFLFVVGAPLFIYRYYLQDYVTDLLKTYHTLKADVQSIPDQLIF